MEYCIGDFCLFCLPKFRACATPRANNCYITYLFVLICHPHKEPQKLHLPKEGREVEKTMQVRFRLPVDVKQLEEVPVAKCEFFKEDIDGEPLMLSGVHWLKRMRTLAEHGCDFQGYTTPGTVDLNIRSRHANQTWCSISSPDGGDVMGWWLLVTSVYELQGYELEQDDIQLVEPGGTGGEALDTVDLYSRWLDLSIEAKGSISAQRPKWAAAPSGGGAVRYIYIYIYKHRGYSGRA